MPAPDFAAPFAYTLPDFVTLVGSTLSDFVTLVASTLSNLSTPHPQLIPSPQRGGGTGRGGPFASSETPDTKTFSSTLTRPGRGRPFDNAGPNNHLPSPYTPHPDLMGATQPQATTRQHAFRASMDRPFDTAQRRNGAGA